MTEYLNNISNINLAFLGISLTLFTVIYSFILNYRENLRGKTNKLSLGDNSPSLKQNIHFLKKNINTFKTINYHLRIVVITSFLLFVIPNIIIEFIKNKIYLEYIIQITKPLFYTEMFYIFVLIFRILIVYNKQTK